MASILEKMMTVQALLFLIVAPPALASTRFLQQASDQAAPPSPGAFTIAAGTCPGVSFNATGLGDVAATCLSANHPAFCCLAVNRLWDSAAIQSPDAAQTLAQAYTDPDVEQGCLQVTEQALQGLGLRPGLVALCARGFTLPPTLQRGANRCPSVDVTQPQIQAVISACQSAQTPGDACGPCFNAITQGAVALVGTGVNATQAVAQAQGIPTAAAGVAVGVRALQQAQDCVQLLKLRTLQQNPIVYKAFALQDLASDLGCRPLLSAIQANVGPAIAGVAGGLAPPGVQFSLPTGGGK